MTKASVLYALAGKRVFVAGHRGMVGSAIIRRLEREGCAQILTISRDELDLRRQADVDAWFKDAHPDAVFLPAAKVGGILANSTYPADFIYDNLCIALNVIHAAQVSGVEKLMFLGSSCIYPKFAPQPIKEESLLTGALEPTNEWYAVAKIAGLKLCAAYRQQYGCDFISAMPTNLYGPGDNFDLSSSHVIPALIRKVHAAKTSNASEVEIWGSGSPLREFLHVDDCADALVYLMKTYSGEMHINVGSGKDITIEALARVIMDVVDFNGTLTHDLTKPDGTPKKLMSAERIRALGWMPRIKLESGLEQTYTWFCDHIAVKTPQLK